jgi:quinol monooxygenase YgiN
MAGRLTMRGLVHVVLAMALAPLAATLAIAQQDPSIYMVTYIEVAPAAQGQTTTLLRQLADASRKDAGLVRFEVLQRTAPSRQFVILESWKDQQAFDAHVATVHHKQFRDRVAPDLIAPIDDRFSVPTLIGPSQPVRGGVVYVVTHVDVPGPVRDKALAALTALSGPSRNDAGNLRFDVVHQQNRTNHFTVVEVWKDQRSNDAHELAAHTRAFRNALTPITGALYDQRWYRPL